MTLHVPNAGKLDIFSMWKYDLILSPSPGLYKWITSSTLNVYRNFEIGGLQGGVFILHSDNRITWFIPADNIIRNFHMLHSKLYSFYYFDDKRFIRYLNFTELLVEFQVETYRPFNDLTMISKEWGIFFCKRIVKNYQINHFSFLPAMEEEFYSDVVIECSNKKKFHLHLMVLNLLGPDIPWQSQPTPFSGLPEEIVHTIVYWLYSERLPKNMTDELATQIIRTVKDYKSLTRLSDACQIYKNKIDLKNRIVTSIGDIQRSLAMMIKYYKGCGGELRNNPAKLCLVLKKTAREMSVVALKFIVLCDHIEKSMLGKYTINPKSLIEKHEVLQYTFLCMPDVVSKLHSLLHYIKTTLTPLTPSQKWEMAAYFVPEIEVGLETVSSIVFEVIMAFEQKLHFDGLVNVPSFHRKVSNTLWDLLEQKKCFSEMTDNNKTRSVLRNLDQIIDELPVLLLRLQDIVDDDMQWKEFKVCFDVVTKKMSAILAKVIENKGEFQHIFEKVCILVQRESFMVDALNIGLLDIVSDMVDCEDSKGDRSNATVDQTKSPGLDMDLVSFLTIPPSFDGRELCKASNELLLSNDNKDVIFEITAPLPVAHTSKSHKTSKKKSSKKEESKSEGDKKSKSKTKSKDHTAVDDKTVAEESSDKSDKNKSTFIKAHRLIISARCNWFKRALQSGMKEAINNHIVIPDTTPEIFKELLFFIYNGHLNPRLICQEIISELILLGDRYELDEMKLDCEILIGTRYLTDENVFYYLGMADQYNAHFLRKQCVEYISKDKHLGNDIVATLPTAMSNEIKDRKKFYSYYKKPDGRPNTGALCPENYEIYTEADDCNDFYSDPDRLEQCITHMQTVLGPFVPEEELNRLIVIADYDVNRAINFYYSELEGDDTSQK